MIGTIATIAAALIINPVAPEQISPDPFILSIHSQALETIERVDSVPGVTCEEFNSIKDRVKQHWNTVVENGVLEIQNSDKDIRSSFVCLQSILESILCRQLGYNIQSLKGVIHTPAPATPLCTEGPISEGLVDASIEKDAARLFTVKVRTQTIREFMTRGGDLYIVYPESGMALRSPTQQAIYKEELIKDRAKQGPSHLFDSPLPVDSIDNEHTGAFYIFENNEGKTYAFAIKITQANNSQDLGSFGLWFGELKKGTPCYERISEINTHVLKFSPLPIPAI